MNNFNDDLETGIYTTRKRNHLHKNTGESHVINIKPRHSSWVQWKNMLVEGLIMSDECPVNSKSYHESRNESCNESCNECTIS